MVWRVALCASELLKENSRLKTQFKLQDEDRAYLTKQLVSEACPGRQAGRQDRQDRQAGQAARAAQARGQTSRCGRLVDILYCPHI